MAITNKKYVDITSSIVGNAQAVQRELIGRLFTTNSLLPTGTNKDFTSDDAVKAYFGSASEEFQRATFNFDYISKKSRSPQKISFARFNSVDVAPLIWGSKLTATLAEYQAITDGAVKLTLGVDTNTITGVDWSTALSFSDLAVILEAAIQAEVGAMWTASTTVYDPTRTAFNFTGGETIDAIVLVEDAGVGTEIKNLIGWGDAAILSDGNLAQTPVEALSESAALSDNFGSFAFMPELTIDEIVENRDWLVGENFKYLYCVPVEDVDAVAYNTALVSGDLIVDENNPAVTLLGEEVSQFAFPEMAPMVSFAAIDFNQPNATINFMYQQYPFLTPSITSTEGAAIYDALKINYYGATQEAGNQIAFYQDGYLIGTEAAAVSINVYANEIWLKDAMTAALINMFLNLDEVPANNTGLAIFYTTVSADDAPIGIALTNGVISAGETLNANQKAKVLSITNDPNAYRKIENTGFWLNAVIATEGAKKIIEYQLVYKGVDDVRKVVGFHSIIAG